MLKQFFLSSIQVFIGALRGGLIFITVFTTKLSQHRDIGWSSSERLALSGSEVIDVTLNVKVERLILHTCHGLYFPTVDLGLSGGVLMH